MNRLGLSLSHSSTLKTVRDVGEDHDKPVLEWKEWAETAEIEGAVSDHHNSLSPSNTPVSSTDSDGSESEEKLTGESEHVSEGTTSSIISEQPRGKESCLHACTCIYIVQVNMTKSIILHISDDYIMINREESKQTSYVIVADNIDKTINPRYMTIDHQRQSLHYMHMYATLDRVSCAHLISNARIGSVMDLSASAFLPSTEDSAMLCANYATLLARVVIKKLPYFAIFSDCVVPHIPHQHTNQMSQKSTVVSN